MKAVIFDHDGTLVDSEGTHHQIWVSLFEPWGIDFPLEDYIEHHSGVPTLRNAELLFETYEIPLEDFYTLFKIKEQATQEHLHNKPFPLLPYVKETLSLCNELKLGIGMATGASNAEAGSTLSSHKIDHYFKSVATRDRVDNAKPAPDVYLLAAKELALAPRECIAIEDTASGIASAKAAGCHCIAIPNEFSHSQDFSEADQLANNLREAHDQIRELTC